MRMINEDRSDWPLHGGGHRDDSQRSLGQGSLSRDRLIEITEVEITEVEITGVEINGVEIALWVIGTQEGNLSIQLKELKKLSKEHLKFKFWPFRMSDESDMKQTRAMGTEPSKAF